MQQDANELYSKIVQAANYFIFNCRRYPIEILAQEDPSYEEIALFAERTSKILHALMDDFDPHMTQQATEHCDLMSAMAAAIRGDQEDELMRLLELLERKPGIV